MPIKKTYDYTDAEGRLLFQVVRFDPKDFRQRRPDGEGGWMWNLKGVQRVLYRFPEILGALRDGRTIYIVEGEKDVEAIEARGFAATCNPMGAGNWSNAFSEELRDANVVILPDNDEQGRTPCGAPRQPDEFVSRPGYTPGPGPLAAFAERLQVAVLVIRHLNKMTGGKAMYRGGGSNGIIGVARIGLMVECDPEDTDQLILASVKNNLAPGPASLTFRLVGSASDPSVGSSLGGHVKTDCAGPDLGRRAAARSSHR